MGGGGDPNNCCPTSSQRLLPTERIVLDLSSFTSQHLPGYHIDQCSANVSGTCIYV